MMTPNVPQLQNDTPFIQGFVVGLVVGAISILLKSPDSDHSVWQNMRQRLSRRATDEAFVEGIAEGRAVAWSRRQDLIND